MSNLCLAKPRWAGLVARAVNNPDLFSAIDPNAALSRGMRGKGAARPLVPEQGIGGLRYQRDTGQPLVPSSMFFGLARYRRL